MIKMFIDNEEVVSDREFTINEEMLSASSTILNNCYPKSWELDRDYISNFYYPKDYSKFLLGEGEFEKGNTEYSVLEATCKNLFKYDGNILYGMNINPENMKIYTDASCNISYIKCKPNTVYTVSRRSPMAIRFYVGTTNEKPTSDVTLLSIRTIFNATSTSITITTPENANYIVVRFIYNEKNEYEKYAKTIQIEEGNQATSYEEYGGGFSYNTNVEKVWNNFNVYGNTYQDTRSGDNLFNPSWWQLRTHNGITATLENGVLVLNGTATNTAYINYSVPDNSFVGSLYWYTKNDSNSSLPFRVNRSQGGVININISNTTAKTQFVSDYVTGGYIQINAGIQLTNCKVYVDIRTQNIDLSNYTFEEYGVMPSPDYPSELVSVGYENLAYTEWAEDFVARINNNEKAKIEIYDNKNCLAYMPNAGYNDYDNKYLFKINWKANTQYTFIFDKYSTGTWGDLDITYTDGTKQELTGLTANAWNHIKMTSQANKTIKYLNAHWRNNALQYIDLDSFGVYEGADTHSYIPYGKYGIEVKTTGKNLFNKNLFNDFTSSLQYLNLQLEPNTTYTMSSSLPPYTTNPLFANLFVMNSTDSPNSTTNSVYPNAPRNVTTLNDGIVKIAYRDGNNDYSDEKNTYWYQLEKGTQSTEYEPYKENTQLYQLDEPLRSIGDTKDLLYIKNGMLYVERNIYSMVLNGTETGWSRYPNRYNLYYYSRRFEGENAKANGGIILSNKFKCVESYWNYQTAVNCCATEPSNPRIGIMLADQTITTADGFKTWLSNNNVEVIYELETPNYEALGYLGIPNSYKGDNNVVLATGLRTQLEAYYYWKNFNVLFAGIVKNSGDISLNPRHPHYCSLQILDYKTFLSESNTLDFVIANKTVSEAINMVVNAISGYGFIVGEINISGADDIIGAYSTLNKTAYDVLQYLAEISGSRWRARYVDSSTMAIDFYDPDTLPQASDIEYTNEYWENNNVVDMSFNYGTRDYRNKQILLSDEVYANINYDETVISNGYSNTFTLQNNVGVLINVLVDNEEKSIATINDKQMGIDADFYYTPGKNVIESNSVYSAGTMIHLTYQPLVKGRQIVYNTSEVERISMQTDTEGVIARYENRNDILSSDELEKIAQTYIEYKGKAEVILTLKTQNKDLYNVGEVVYFDAPIDELKQNYMVKNKKIEYVIIKEIINLFYVYELTSSFNSEKAINYFDNQRNKASGNIAEGESITRNVDIETGVSIVWSDGTVSSASITVDGNNVLNSALNSPFIE